MTENSDWPFSEDVEFTPEIGEAFTDIFGPLLEEPKDDDLDAEVIE